jgi:hypothetical protein
MNIKNLIYYISQFSAVVYALSSVTLSFPGRMQTDRGWVGTKKKKKKSEKPATTPYCSLLFFFLVPPDPSCWPSPLLVAGYRRAASSPQGPLAPLPPSLPSIPKGCIGPHPRAGHRPLFPLRLPPPPPCRLPLPHPRAGRRLPRSPRRPPPLAQVPAPAAAASPGPRAGLRFPKSPCATAVPSPPRLLHVGRRSPSPRRPLLPRPPLATAAEAGDHWFREGAALEGDGLGSYLVADED